MTGKKAAGEVAFFPYQEDCVEIIKKASISRNRILLSIATGFGRSRIVVQALKELLDTRSIKRALLLTPRSAILDMFSGLLSQRSLQNTKLTLREYTRNQLLKEIASVPIVLSSLRDFAGVPGGVPHNFFDVVFLDECHTLTDNDWTIVRNLRSAQVGLTSLNPSFVSQRVLAVLGLDKPTYIYGAWSLKLKNIAHIFLGASCSSNDLSSRGEWKFIRPHDVRNNRILKADTFVSDSVAERHPESFLGAGDILLQSIFIFDLDKLALVTKDDLPAIASSDFFVIRSRTTSPSFLVDYLQGKTVREVFLKQIEQLAHGSPIKHLTLSDVQEMPIPLLFLRGNMNESFIERILKIGEEGNIENVKKARNEIRQLLRAYRLYSRLEEASFE